MNLKLITLISGVAFSACAQGTFQNLDFESATLDPVPVGHYGGEVPISSAMPGWTGYLGGIQTSQVLQNNYTLGSASVDIFGPDWQATQPGIIGGNYTIMLQAGSIAGSTQADASIVQTGQIPGGAESLQFSVAELYSPNSAFSVSFAGENLPAFLLSAGTAPSGQAFSVYGVDIVPFAGQTGEVEFTSVYDATEPGLMLDNITFSSTAVPEPNPLSLTGFGTLLFAAYCRLVVKQK